jgi:hypothetical protein
MYNSYIYKIEMASSILITTNSLKGFLGFGVLGFWAALPSNESHLT